MKNKTAQNEMVGFVLIVVLVVVGIFVFMLISARMNDSIEDGDEVKNLLSSLMSQTSECADYEPNYYPLWKVIKVCDENDARCNNLDKQSCDYLNESLREIMKKVMRTESGFISAYQIDITHKTENSEKAIIPRILKGNCTGSAFKSQEIISTSGEGKIVVEMRICYTQTK